MRVHQSNFSLSTGDPEDLRSQKILLMLSKSEPQRRANGQARFSDKGCKAVSGPDVLLFYESVLKVLDKLRTRFSLCVFKWFRPAGHNPKKINAPSFVSESQLET